MDIETSASENRRAVSGSLPIAATEPLVPDAEPPVWHAFVELIRITIFATAHVCAGSLGAGIVCVSVGVRLALLPLTLRVARAARDKQAILAALKPQLDAIQRRHANDPPRMLRETRALHAEHGVRLMDTSTLVGFLLQAPLLGGLFAAVRSGLGARVSFLWVADLARPDGLLLTLVAVLGGAMLAMPRPADAPAAPSVLMMALLGIGATLFFLWSASSAVALSVGAGSLVSGLQGWLLLRDKGQTTRST